MWTAENRAFVGDFGAGQSLSDEQYALLAPLIPPAKPGGRPRTTDMQRLLDGRLYPRLKVVFADSAYDRLAALLACFLLGLTLVVIRRLAGTKGFVLLPRRWVAERTLGWLGRWRRLAREYEELPEVSETMVKLAMIRLMLHRLAHPNRKRLPAP